MDDQTAASDIKDKYSRGELAWARLIQFTIVKIRNEVAIVMKIPRDEFHLQYC